MSTQEIYAKFNAVVNEAKLVNNDETIFSKITHCLNCIKEEYREILNKSYFAQDYKFWWIDFYSETTYYKKRFRAITSFVYLYDSLNEDFDIHFSNDSIAE